MLTRLAAFDQPDLVIWPESSFPGYFNRDLDSGRVRELVAELGVPLVLGSPHLEGADDAYNSAYLLNEEGETVSRYDKLYLVPFGEYVPLKSVLGWLEPLAYRLGVSDFRAGKDFTIFRLPAWDMPFGVLICFEDVFARLARNLAARGARFLVVITNDAWFGPTGAPYQHLEASVLRAVENGIPVVRAANTGVSAFITAQGKVLGRVRGKNGEDIFTSGKATYALPLPSGPATLFRQGGWIFPYAAAGLFLCMAAALLIIRKGRGGVLPLAAPEGVGAR
jgi:apolipoprotein N-acyltransferase